MGNESGCGCGTTKNNSLTIGTAPRENNMSTETNTIVSLEGLTCGHCVASVTEEIEALEAVTSVSIELVAGGISTATISSTGPLSTSEISEAVAEAGYTLIGDDA